MFRLEMNLLEVEVEVKLPLTVSQATTDGLSASKLGFQAHSGTVNRCYFLSEGCCLKVADFSLWDAYFDDRSALSFFILSL
jgi:hypothetical protein